LGNWMKLGHSPFSHHPILVQLIPIDFSTFNRQRNRCKAKVVWTSYIERCDIWKVYYM
jgi:hypothetical protein